MGRHSCLPSLIAHVRAPCGRSCVRSSRARAAASASDRERVDAALFALGAPALASVLLDPFMGAIDTAYVGRLPSDDALSALAVSATCFSFCFKMFNFFAVVVGAATARANGNASANEDGEWRDDDFRAKAREIVSASVVVAFALGCATCIGLEWFSDEALYACGATRGVGVEAFQGVENAGATTMNSVLWDDAEKYLRIRALALPAATVSLVGVGAFRGLLDAKTPLVVACVVEAVHFALDPILIFGFGPIVGMDVAGAAIATTTAEWIGAALFVKYMMDERILDARAMFTAPKELDELAALARGSSAQLTRTVFLQVVLVSATATASTLGVAGAHQLCLQLWWVTLFGLDSIAVSAQALVAASLGKNDVVGARNAADRALQWGVSAGVIVGAVVFALAPSIPYLFTNDASIAAEAVTPIRIIALLQPLNSAVFVGDGVLQGASDFDYLAKAMAFAAGVGALGIAVYSSADDASLASVWAGVAALMTARAATLGWRYYRDDASPLRIERALEAVAYSIDDVDER